MYSSIINVNCDPDSNIIKKYSKSNFIKKKKNL